MPTLKRALIAVDLQPDFCEGGRLAVPGGWKTSAAVAKHINDNHDNYDILITSQDWHKADDTNGGHIALGNQNPDFKDSWPVHCIAETEGASLVPVIDAAISDWLADGLEYINVKKGYGTPSYSAFDANVIISWKNTEAYPVPGESLRSILQRRNIGHVDVVGLAYEHCVKATAVHSSLAQSVYQVTEVLVPLTSAIDWRAAIAATREMASKKVEVTL